MLNIIESGSNPHDDTTSMSFLKGADRDDSGMDLSLIRGNSNQTVGCDIGDKGDYPDYNEWDAMTARMEENYEITSEARDYNNADIDDSRSEIQFDDESMNQPDGQSSDAY